MCVSEKKHKFFLYICIQKKKEKTRPLEYNEMMKKYTRLYLLANKI